jgi:indole-3-acetate monooxygenase
MTYVAGQAGAEDSSVLHAAIGLAEQIRAASDEIETGRRIPQSIATAMRETGIFGMVMPRAWGGPELDPLTQIRVIEALAMADGSVGWCAMIGCDSGYITAFLDQGVARAMYPDLLVATGAAATTTGKARRVPGGYRVDGRFPFVSGCHHWEWAWLGCTIFVDGAQRVDGNGVPETRQCFLRLSQCEILDTWYTTGLCGTGSNDLAVRDVFVPEEHTFSFQDPQLIKRSGPLYAFPFMFIAKGPGTALGIARHAIDALIETAAGKPARRYTLGERVEVPKLLRDDVYVQDAVGRAETLLTSARAHAFKVVGDLWGSLLDGRQPTDRQLALFTTLTPHVFGVCVEVVSSSTKRQAVRRSIRRDRSIAACATS